MFDSIQVEPEVIEAPAKKSNRGGPRPGSGRKKGDVGRFRHLLNERTKAAVAKQEATPLEYMLRVLNDPNTDQKRKDAMAIAAAPYIHARLAATEHSGKLEMTHEDRLKALAE